MKLKLKITSGPLQGREYPLAAGMLIGRSSADITINDPKVSGRHAKIESDLSGELILIDLGSNNGLRVQENRLDQVALRPGLVVQIGSTFCEVFVDYEADTVAPEGLIVALDELTIPPGPAPVVKKWPEYLYDFIQRSLLKIKSRPQALEPFHPMVVLTITGGLQSGTQWFLGYGPRYIGANSLDFALMEPGIPAQAFKVYPLGESAVFETNQPEKVRLNERSISSVKLESGDEISLLNTRITVSFQ